MPLIAVDGPAASGKGTIARALGHHFHLPHLDTGALYRAVALAAVREGVDPDDERACVRLADGLDFSLLSDPDLRLDATGAVASRLSAHPEVRRALLSFQRAFAARPGGAILDGRDIGTVILPGADAKIFVTAAPEVRAHRRFLELRKGNADIQEKDVLQSLLLRDERDRTRKSAPLLKAEDAYLLDTSNLDIGAAVRKAIEFVADHPDRTS